MASFPINPMNATMYDYAQSLARHIRDDQTHGSIKDSDSTRAMYRWEGGDVDRMLEHTFNGSRVEVRPGPTSLKGSWNPSEVHAKPVCFPLGHEEAFTNAELTLNLSRPTLSYVSDRLLEANINMFLAPPADVHTLVSLLMGHYQTSEALAASGGHDVRLLMADCLAELNAELYDVVNACGCSNDTDKGQAHEARLLLNRLKGNTFFYVTVFHIHAAPADVYIIGAAESHESSDVLWSRPRLTPFGALSELPRLLPENKTKEQLEAIDAMYELIGSPWKVWL